MGHVSDCVPLAACCRGELGENITKLLEEVPRATSAPPHLQDRWGTVSGMPSVLLLSCRWSFADRLLLLRRAPPIPPVPTVVGRA